MNIDFRSTLVVMRKELRDFYRDRRTFLMTLLLSPILFPAIMLGMFKLMENRASTQLEKDMTIPVAGSEFAPNLLAHLASHGIAARRASVAEVEQAVRSQEDDVGLVIDPGFGKDWHAGVPAKVELVTDTTRRNADVPVKRVEATLQQYSQTLGALRMLARGINPMVGVPVGVGTRDLATPEAKRGIMLSAMLPILLLISAFLGGIHLAMDTTAGERERQSLEPLLATPAARGAIVSGKMLASVVIGLASLLLILLALKGSASLATGMGRMLDVSMPAIAKLLFILLPLVVIGTGADHLRGGRRQEHEGSAEPRDVADDAADDPDLRADGLAAEGHRPVAVRGAVPVAEPAGAEGHPRRVAGCAAVGGLPGLRAGPGRGAVAGGGVALPAGEAGDLRLIERLDRRAMPVDPADAAKKKPGDRRAFSLRDAAPVTAGTKWCGGWWWLPPPAGSASA
jgi:sodium transport system permease protein